MSLSRKRSNSMRNDCQKSAPLARSETPLSRRATDTTLGLALSVQSAYYNALRSDADYALAKDDLATAQQFADAAKTQYQAGDAAQSNVLRSETEVARSQQDLTAAQTERSNRYATLASLIGVQNAKLVLTDQLKLRIGGLFAAAVTGTGHKQSA